MVALVAQLSTSFPVKEKVPSIFVLSIKVTFIVPETSEQPPVLYDNPPVGGVYASTESESAFNVYVPVVVIPNKFIAMLLLLISAPTTCIKVNSPEPDLEPLAVEIPAIDVEKLAPLTVAVMYDPEGVIGVEDEPELSLSLLHDDSTMVKATKTNFEIDLKVFIKLRFVS